MGARRELRVAGVPVGEEIPDLLPCTATRDSTVLRGMPRCASASAGGSSSDAADAGAGSIIIIVATDAPLLPDQCRRIARRATIGLARVGGNGNNGSGDLFLAFSTANRGMFAGNTYEPFAVQSLQPDAMTPLFEATADATEEAIVNALCMATTVTGVNGRTSHAVPLDRVRELMAKYNRLAS
jgi:L-aminopeptidase/D-esterase-like protein